MDLSQEPVRDPIRERQLQLKRSLFLALKKRGHTSWACYLDTVKKFLVAKLSKEEADEITLDLLGEENGSHGAPLSLV
jgi:hypothetical protein